MPIGSFKQKANPILVGFVVGCISITIILLFAMEKSLTVADSLSSNGKYTLSD
jgi:hypothetical protein